MKRRMTWRVEGMFCPHCEQTVMQAVRKLNGLENAAVSYRAGTLSALWDEEALSEKRLADCLAEQGYTLKRQRSALHDGIAFIGGIAALALLGWAIQATGLDALVNAFPTAKAGMSLGMLFLVGMMTSLHCVAMCGGFSVAGGANDRTTKSAVFYNLGRVVSYTLTGALVGALGTVFSLSQPVKAGIQIAAAAFMLTMALNLLGCFSFLRKLPLRLPDGLRIRGIGHSAFALGLANGLMPCGPLQAMQLFALSSGSWHMGALSMLCFSLGTVPLMLGVGVASGKLNRRFAKPMRLASAALVAVMGMNMMQNGFALAGVNTVLPAGQAVMRESQDGVAAVQDGVQVVHTTLDYRSYAPITVQAGMPVRWTISAESRVLNGCNNALVIPEFGIQKTLEAGENVIEFTPQEGGVFPYSCWMGMIRSTITVVE